jgi:hypothetical protein
MLNLKTTCATLFLVLSITNCYSQKLNEIQVIGSHNSYKKAMDTELWNYLNEMDHKTALTLEYEHIPLKDQLDLGLRALELDVYYDPNGGHYSNPKGLDVVRSKGGSPMPYNEKELLKPGFKLMHVQDLDFRTHHILLKDALKVLLAWSKQNPAHDPIFITMNTNDEKIPQLRDPLPFTKIAYDSLDMEIRSVLKERVIDPDKVRKAGMNLEESILKHGWGDLSNYKNGFIFVLDASPESSQHDLYIKNNPNLSNRVFFTNSKEGTPSAAIRIINDPIVDFEYIRSLVKKGYIIRTRADADTKEARENDYSRLEKAKESGAHIISTDYYQPSRFFKSDYKCEIE